MQVKDLGLLPFPARPRLVLKALAVGVFTRKSRFCGTLSATKTLETGEARSDWGGAG